MNRPSFHKKKTREEKRKGRSHVFYVHFWWNRAWPADSVSPSNRISDMQQGFCIAAILCYFDCGRCVCRWVYARNGHSRESVEWCERFPFFRCHFHQRCKCIDFHFDPVSCDKPNLQYHNWFDVCVCIDSEKMRKSWRLISMDGWMDGRLTQYRNLEVYSHMWWQFEIVWSSVALNCVRRIVCNRLIRIDSNDKGTNVCLVNKHIEKKRCIYLGKGSFNIWIH